MRAKAMRKITSGEPFIDAHGFLYSRVSTPFVLYETEERRVQVGNRWCGN